MTALAYLVKIGGQNSQSRIVTISQRDKENKNYLFATQITVTEEFKYDLMLFHASFALGRGRSGYRGGRGGRW